MYLINIYFNFIVTTYITVGIIISLIEYCLNSNFIMLLYNGGYIGLGTP